MQQIKLRDDLRDLWKTIVHLLKCLALLPTSIVEFIAQFISSVCVVVILLLFWGSNYLKGITNDVLETSSDVPELFRHRENQ